jgi:hypothetical protein
MIPPTGRSSVCLEAEGEALSILMLRRAEWTAARAAGDVRAMGLAAAQAYAVAAVATHPDNRQAQELLGELELLEREEQQLFIQRSHALAHFDECAAELFDNDLAAAAKVAENEAWKRCSKGRFNLSLLVVDLL